jgi:hypothetical protein
VAVENGPQRPIERFDDGIYAAAGFRTSHAVSIKKKRAPEGARLMLA